MTLEPDRPIVISRHAALKTRAQGETLVLPERAIRIAGSGAEILRLCDAPRTPHAVAEELARRYPEAEDVESEVLSFLGQMRELGGVDEARDGAVEASPARVSQSAAVSVSASVSPSDLASPSDPSDPAPAPTLAPLNLIAELTYRCPLQCPYCSNPIAFREHREALSASDWGRVFDEAAALGVVHVGLTGGEPSVRKDLEEILARAVAADLYPHLVTAGLPLDPDRLAELAALGLRSVQVSIQDANAAGSDHIAGTRSFEQKLAICEKATELGLALTLNCVLHRHNLASVPEVIALAERFHADRLELANTQYHGWALRNRAALMPTREQLAEASLVVREAQQRQRTRDDGPSMLFVLPDYFSDRPKPCMGGWGRLAMVVDPTGQLLPCHDAATLPGLDFWNVEAHSVGECWRDAPGMNAYRGQEWMPEPCRGCPEREKDFGGCRCQAFRLLGDASKTDPACGLSPEHAVIAEARDEARIPAEFEYRR